MSECCARRQHYPAKMTPNGNSAFPFKGQLTPILHHSSWPRKRKKLEALLLAAPARKTLSRRILEQGTCTSTFCPRFQFGNFVAHHDLVGGCYQRSWNSQPKCLGGLGIDDQFESYRLLYWQVGWPFALENPARVDARKAVCIDEIGSVTDQPTCGDKFTKSIARRNCVARSRRNHLITLA